MQDFDIRLPKVGVVENRRCGRYERIWFGVLGVFAGFLATSEGLSFVVCGCRVHFFLFCSIFRFPGVGSGHGPHPAICPQKNKI